MQVLPVSSMPFATVQEVQSDESDEEEAFIAKGEALATACGICQSADFLSGAPMHCSDCDCKKPFHVNCLRRALLEKGQPIPVEGKCPECSGEIVWAELVVRRRHGGTGGGIAFKGARVFTEDESSSSSEEEEELVQEQSTDELVEAVQAVFPCARDAAESALACAGDDVGGAVLLLKDNSEAEIEGDWGKGIDTLESRKYPVEEAVDAPAPKTAPKTAFATRLQETSLESDSDNDGDSLLNYNPIAMKTQKIQAGAEEEDDVLFAVLGNFHHDAETVEEEGRYTCETYGGIDGGSDDEEEENVIDLTFASPGSVISVSSHSTAGSIGRELAKRKLVDEWEGEEEEEGGKRAAAPVECIDLTQEED